MSLDATRLGTDLFQALVCLRHNAKLFRAWRGVRAGEFAVEVEEGNETDADMAATFKAIDKATTVNVFKSRAAMPRSPASLRTAFREMPGRQCFVVGVRSTLSLTRNT